MKKSNFFALILGTIGVVFFALGMCMAPVPAGHHLRHHWAGRPAGHSIELAEDGREDSHQA